MRIDEQIATKQREIEKLLEEKARLEALDPARKLAEWLHEKLCRWNHTDGCSWLYETWDSQHRAAHDRYLRHARELIAHLGGEEAVRAKMDEYEELIALFGKIR